MKLLPFAVVMTLLFGCSKSENGNTSPETREEEFIEVVDIPPKYILDFESQECKIQLENAQADVKKGKLVYRINSNKIIRYSDEIKELLGTYGIEYENLGPKCLPTQECYRYYMDSVIFSRFGDSFISVLEEKADSIFLARWETKVYEYWDLDKEPKYSEGRGFADIFIEKRIKLPENWDSIPMQHERQFFSVVAIINNKGKLVDWEIDMHNLKKTNEKHLTYLKKEINAIVSKMEDWEPGILNNKKVASEYHIDISLDKRIY